MTLVWWLLLIMMVVFIVILGLIMYSAVVLGEMEDNIMNKFHREGKQNEK